jgi:hypothetical protein
MDNRTRLHKYARRLADHLLVASQDEREELFARIRAGLRLRGLPFPWAKAARKESNVLTLRRRKA